MKIKIFTIILIVLVSIISCTKNRNTKLNDQKELEGITAKDILGNPKYQAISYGGYRKKSRDIQPTITELKEDMKILFAMGIRILRTYNVQLPHATNLVKAIRELIDEDSDFEMYVMLGAWIDCAGAWTNTVNHDVESPQNALEITRAVALAKQYPDVIKIISVGNESMVKWATSYYVKPSVILKWVNYLQNLKKNGKLDKNLWITSSDNFASWGGGGKEYHVDDLNKLIKAVDYISMHTYPMHDTYFNPSFWGVSEDEGSLSNLEKTNKAIERAVEYSKAQYEAVRNYMLGLGVNKPVHVGETGWATQSKRLYGNDGTKATDEYKQAQYYHKIREWTNKEKISCFYFEAFDEIWKSAKNPKDAENHFGLFTVDGKAKHALSDMIDKGIFNGLTRGGNPITKTYNVNEDLLNVVKVPPKKKELVIEF